MVHYEGIVFKKKILESALYWCIAEISRYPKGKNTHFLQHSFKEKHAQKF